MRYPKIPMPKFDLDPDELRQWQANIEMANRNNILCHCRQCDREWVASERVPCTCGSRRVEYIICWQFPDDWNGIQSFLLFWIKTLYRTRAILARNRSSADCIMSWGESNNFICETLKCLLKLSSDTPSAFYDYFFKPIPVYLNCWLVRS